MARVARRDVTKALNPIVSFLVALALFGGIYLLRELAGDSRTGLSFLYVFPVVLLALRFGARAGAVGAVLAIFLTVLDANGDNDIPTTGYVTRSLVLVGVAALVGWFVDREKRMQRLREETQAKVRHFFDLSKDMLCTADAAGYFIDLNPAWERTLGYTEEELRSQPFVEMVHPDDREATAAEAAKIFEGQETVDFENRYLAKDGGVHWLHWNSVLGPDGLLYARATDITERRRTDQLVRSLMESAPDAMLVVDSEGMVRLANSRAEEVFGRARPELIEEPIETLLPGGVEETEGRDAVGRRADGSEFPAEVTVSPLTTEHGSFLIAAVRDVTDRKRDEEELRELAAALERSNEELGQFAYIASHDLGEPLRTIAGFAQLLEKRYEDQVDERGRDYIARMTAGVGRMQRMIADLLSFSRAGSAEVERQRVDTAALVGEVLENLGQAISEKGVEIQIGELPEVEADRNQLQQVFQNLIGNAIKFNDSADPKVEIDGSSEPDGWRFTVADNGIGIAPEKREKIFIAFQRLHSRDEYAGTGMGLAICSKIVERHGGRLTVEDGLDERGSTFAFTIGAQ